MNSLFKLIFLLLCWHQSCFSKAPFVTVDFLGQLGNQMFQIAAATSLALDHDAEALFPKVLINGRIETQANLDHVLFRINIEKLPQEPEITYQDPDNGYTPIPYHANMNLKGYFQSYKYFEHHKEHILKLFAPSESILKDIHSRYSHILQHPHTVSIHIRNYKMEDYLGQYLPNVSWNYIKTSMALSNQHSLFVVFSNSIRWVKSCFVKYGLTKTYNVIFIESEPNYIDLYLMSLCKDNIISNSTFSWWGAYLNPNPQKKVFAPTRWLGSKVSKEYKAKTQEALIPKDWILIDG